MTKRKLDDVNHEPYIGSNGIQILKLVLLHGPNSDEFTEFVFTHGRVCSYLLHYVQERMFVPCNLLRTIVFSSKKVDTITKTILIPGPMVVSIRRNVLFSKLEYDGRFRMFSLTGHVQGNYAFQVNVMSDVFGEYLSSAVFNNAYFYLNGNLKTSPDEGNTLTLYISPSNTQFINGLQQQ